MNKLTDDQIIDHCLKFSLETGYSTLTSIRKTHGENSDLYKKSKESLEDILNQIKDLQKRRSKAV
jgi:hypothetical protein